MQLVSIYKSVLSILGNKGKIEFLGSCFKRPLKKKSRMKPSYMFSFTEHELALFKVPISTSATTFVKILMGTVASLTETSGSVLCSVLSNRRGFSLSQVI